MVIQIKTPPESYSWGPGMGLFFFFKGKGQKETRSQLIIKVDYSKQIGFTLNFRDQECGFKM